MEQTREQETTLELKDARAVRVALAEMNVKQNVIARLAGISQSHLSDALQGRTSYTPLLRIRIERAVAEAQAAQRAEQAKPAEPRVRRL
jgi:predicted XRE-type DNA-binding protein